MKKIENVHSYLECFDGKVLNDLEKVRKQVSDLVPGAVESLSYGIIAYKYNGKPLLYIGGFKYHIGLYATPIGHEAFQDELSKFKQGKGSVQFPAEIELPFDLIRRIIIFRKNTIETMKTKPK